MAKNDWRGETIAWEALPDGWVMMRLIKGVYFLTTATMLPDRRETRIRCHNLAEARQLWREALNGTKPPGRY